MGSSADLSRRLSAMVELLDQRPEEERFAPESAADVDLTIGIATFDDFDGAFFTVTALCLYHPEVTERAEILVLDNHPRGRAAAALRTLERMVPQVRYVPVETVTSTAVRDLIFRRARGDIVVVLDSHVLVRPGGIAAAVAQLADPTCRDLVQGPLVAYDGRSLIGTHWDPIWQQGMYGRWAHDDRGEDPDAEPFDIPLQGLGAFAARRAHWPGLNPHFSGFGGEEGYLHEKIRQAGGRTVCVPAFRWLHRFERPLGVSYPLRWEERVRNYVVGWSELGLPVDDVQTHFADFLGPAMGDYIAGLRVDVADPLWRVDGVAVLNDDLRPGGWRSAVDALSSISLVPRRVALGEPRRAGTLDGLPDALAHARSHGWSSVLVVGDAAVRTAADVGRISAQFAQQQTAAAVFDDGRGDPQRLALSLTGSTIEQVSRMLDAQEARPVAVEEIMERVMA
jgi:hypothetical protein